MLYILLTASGLALKVQRHDSLAQVLTRHNHQPAAESNNVDNAQDEDNSVDRHQIGAKLNRYTSFKYVSF